MQSTSEAPAPPTQPVDSARPAVAATVVLALIMVITALPPIRLGLVELAPVTALIEGIRLPAGLPHLGMPFGEHWVIAHWLIETLTALVLLGAFWLLCRAARLRRANRSRGRVFAQVWLDVIFATVLACLLRSALISVLTEDTRLSYVLLIAGTVLFAVLAGLAVGLLAAIAAALAQPSATQSAV